jgi:hypothetical protein
MIPQLTLKVFNTVIIDNIIEIKSTSLLVKNIDNKKLKIKKSRAIKKI